MHHTISRWLTFSLEGLVNAKSRRRQMTSARPGSREERNARSFENWIEGLNDMAILGSTLDLCTVKR